MDSSIKEGESGFKLSRENYVQIGLVLLGVMIIRFYFNKSAQEKERRLKKELSFLVPKEGGALQKMSKDSDENITLRLAKKIQLTHDTYIFRYSFQNPDWTFGLPLGQHVIFTATIPTKEHPEGEAVSRKYTPTSPIQNKGFVDFVIKIYRKNQHPRFPDGGIMTQFLEEQQPGATMLMDGPKGRLIYQGMGKFLINRQPLRKTTIGMVSGGTGITPCYQVIQAALNGDDGTKLSLIFANRSVDDILMREELDQYAANYPDRFHLHYSVDTAPATQWKYSVGFVTKDILKNHMPAPSEDTIILFCGPPPFEDMMKNHLKELGYSEDMMFKF